MTAHDKLHVAFPAPATSFNIFEEVVSTLQHELINIEKVQIKGWNNSWCIFTALPGISWLVFSL